MLASILCYRSLTDYIRSGIYISGLNQTMTDFGGKVVVSQSDLLGTRALVKVGEYCDYAEAVFGSPEYAPIAKSQGGGILAHFDDGQFRIMHIMPDLSSQEIAEFMLAPFKLTLGEYGPDRVIALVLQGPPGKFDMTYEPRLHEIKDRPNLTPSDYSKLAGKRIPVRYYLFSTEGYITRAIRFADMSSHMSYLFAAMMQARQHDRKISFPEHSARVGLVCKEYSLTALAKAAQCYSIVAQPSIAYDQAPGPEAGL